MGYRMKKNNKTFDFGNRMDLNVDRYGPSATQSNFDFKSEKTKNKRGWSTDKHGERDFSEHNIATEETEDTIEEQEKTRNKKSPNKMWGKVVDTAIGALKEDTAALERANNRNISAASIQRK